MSSNTCSESTNRLREKIHAYQTTERNAKRENCADSFRPGLGEISRLIHELEHITEKDVSGLASRIKRRKHANVEDMFRLSHAFLQSEDNIVTFTKIPGALNVIVKELTGTDSKSQIMACEVLCNLSLGDSIPSEKIALAAGSYLLTNLDNSDPRLQRTSLWVINNILHTGDKGYATLVSQEIAAKLLNLIMLNKQHELYNDILIALDILLDKDVNVFRSDQLQDLQHHLQQCKTLNGLQMKVFFTILFSTDTLSIKDDDLPIIIKSTIFNLNDIQNVACEENTQKILYSIRILSNLSSKLPVCTDLIDRESISNLNTTFASIVNKILSWNNKLINLETLWLVSNLVSSEQILGKTDSILENIQISKLTVF